MLSEDIEDAAALPAFPGASFLRSADRNRIKERRSEEIKRLEEAGAAPDEWIRKPLRETY